MNWLLYVEIAIIIVLTRHILSEDEIEERSWKFGKFSKKPKVVFVPVPYKVPSKPQFIFAPAPKVSCPPKIITIPKTEYVTVPQPAGQPKVVMIPSPPVPPKVVFVKSPPGPIPPPKVIVIPGPPSPTLPPQVIIQKVPVPVPVPVPAPKGWRK